MRAKVLLSRVVRSGLSFLFSLFVFIFTGEWDGRGLQLESGFCRCLKERNTGHEDKGVLREVTDKRMSTLYTCAVTTTLAEGKSTFKLQPQITQQVG